MEYWLFKSEPSTWSWKDQVKKGKEGEGWDGVRNYQANNNMKKMKIGDLGFFYHSVKEKQIVGIVRVIGEHRPDPTDKKGIFGMVVIEAVKEVNKYVHLSDIKSNKKCPDFVIKDIEMDGGQGIYLFDKDDFLDSMESLYCEEYIDADKHLNTYHLVGKEKSFDVTNYKKLNYIDTPKYQLLDQKEEILNRLGLPLSSHYRSYYNESNEYK